MPTLIQKAGSDIVAVRLPGEISVEMLEKILSIIVFQLEANLVGWVEET